jgi:cytochrome c553
MKKILLGLTLISTMMLAADGAASFAKCADCHGQKAEKKALGKSKIVAQMSKEEIVSALKGYKTGTYGGPMKGLMKGQVASLDEAGIEAVATYISGLK